jgi:hypothetical protein
MPFDYKTASAIARYEAIHAETLRDFSYAARQTWDELQLSKRENSSLQREIRNLLGEIDVLKNSLLEAEATPQPVVDAKPIAAVKGYYNGECVIQALDPALVLPVGMALYSSLQPVVDVNQQLVVDKYEKLEPALESLVNLCNNFGIGTYDEVIAAEAALERLYLARKALLSAGKGGE